MRQTCACCDNGDLCPARVFLEHKTRILAAAGTTEEELQRGARDLAERSRVRVVCGCGHPAPMLMAVDSERHVCHGCGTIVPAYYARGQRTEAAVDAVDETLKLHRELLFRRHGLKP